MASTRTPPDLDAFTAAVRTRTGLRGGDVGAAPDPRHKASGAYHCGCQDIKDLGKYPDGDYSTRQLRDRVGGNDCSAFDIGDDWPNGGRAAWLRFGNTLAAALRAGDPELGALRAVNWSPDGTVANRKRYDANNPGQGVVNNTDSTYMHLHGELWRNTQGTPGRSRTFARVLQLIDTAIGGTPTGGTMPDDVSIKNAEFAATVAVRGDSTLTLNGGAYSTPNVLHAKLDKILTQLGVAQADIDDIQARTGAVGISDAQAAMQANLIADRLVASNANGLTAADHAALVADVKQALREGSGTP